MAKRKAISAVITCGDWLRFENEVAKIEENDIEYIHVDVMDGMFVPNITIGPSVIQCYRPHTRLPFDVHLMIVDPIRYIKEFARAGAD